MGGSRRWAMANRGVFSLTVLVMVLFFLASHYDNSLFLLHFLEAVIYGVILLLLFYGIEEWAYPMAFLSPLLWTILTGLSGTLTMGVRSLWQAVSFQQVTFGAQGVVAGLIFVAGLLLIIASGRAFCREIYGRPGIASAVVGSVVVVAVYYAVVLWAWLQLLSPAGS